MNRRNILTMLGLGAAGLVNTEAVGDPEITQAGFPNLARPSIAHQERIASALESLAKEIRLGNVAATTLLTTSRLTVNEWLAHDVTVSVEILQDQDFSTE